MVSTYNLVCFNIERWFAITFPIKHMALVTKKHIVIICIHVWLVCIIYNLARFISTTQIIENGVCYWWSNWTGNPYLYEFAQILHIVLWFVLPFICLVFTNTSILLYIRRRNKKWQSNKPLQLNGADEEGFSREKKFEKVELNTLKTLVTVSMAFCLCFILDTVWLFLNKVKAEFAQNELFFDVAVILMFINVSINPALYAIQFKDFQVEAKNLFCRKCST